MIDVTEQCTGSEYEVKLRWLLFGVAWLSCYTKLLAFLFHCLPPQFSSTYTHCGVHPVSQKKHDKMGSAASTGNTGENGSAAPPFSSVEDALAAGKTQDEIDAWLKAHGKQEEQGTAGDSAGPDWAAMFAHKGDYAAQVEQFGPAPDYADATSGWYWYGQDGSAGCELAPPVLPDEEEAGASGGGNGKVPAAERPADVFYVHPSTYVGKLWNMPVNTVECEHSTQFFTTVETSAFNGTCRIFAPRFRQSVVAGMGYAEEGRLATDLAYADVKRAFEHYLTHENKGRPFFLASHSQGSLYTLRLMREFIEGKPLFSQFVACYGWGAWAPLSLFKGPKAVFQQIKTCQRPTDVGCFISWTCEHPEEVKQHRANKDSGEPGQWYPQMGHKIGEDDWRCPHGEPIVGTDPFTWVSNGLQETTGDGAQEHKPPREEWLGMLNVLAGTETPDMDTLNTHLFTPNCKVVLRELVRMSPEKFAGMFEEKEAKEDGDAAAVVSNLAVVDKKTGDLQLVPLPAAIGGSSTESYEHMNILLFWFNIRKNIAVRLGSMMSASDQ